MPVPPLLAPRLISALAARAFALVVVGTGVGFVANAARHDGVRFSAFVPPVACTSPAGAIGPTAASDEATIAPRKAASFCGRPDVVVLDARSAKRYAEGHVAGAVHLPCDAAGEAAYSAIAGLERAGTVIVYGEHDSDAEPVADSLRARLPQPKRVMILEGGFAAWEAASLSCVSGPCDECSGVSASHPSTESAHEPRRTP